MKKFKHLIDELHNLICQADENNRAFVIEKLSDQTINQINAFAKQNDFVNIEFDYLARYIFKQTWQLII